MKERYEIYRDSGIPWIGQVPQGWEVVPNKKIMHKIKDICIRYNNEDILSLTMKGVIIRDLDAGGKMPTTFNGYQRLYPGNLLMCLFDIDVTPRCIGLIKNEGLCSPAYSQFVLHDQADAGYYYYYYLSLDNTKELLIHAKNLRNSLTEEQLGALPIPLPPLPEQRAIAAYLDARCAAIDAYVASLEREAGLARELKQALIARAVTRGLDPNTPMRNSGIPWIGQVPAAWEVVRVKHYLKITNGCDPTTEGDVPVYGSGSTSFKTCGEYKKGPTVLLGRKGTINIPQYVEGKYWNVDTAFDVKSKGGFDLKLFYYMATCFDYESYMTQTAVPSMAQSDYNNIKIPLPPLPVQRAIADYLDARCAAIDAYVASLEREAALARELKAREIADAVTGKVKITG